MGLIESLSMLGVGSVLVALITWASSRTTARSERESKEIEARGPEWQAYSAEIREWVKMQLAEQDKKISALEKQVAKLQLRADEWKTKYLAALHHIRQWRCTFPAGMVGPDRLEIPPEIANDLE
ncbi:hypothetical protein [Corynebacterium sp. TAE3-ERU2]|uniref:hypothetical protein n=1 Tax=Corynebacterium sp. TAE3-ERU2 TaxID=2849497 RepID=UPI001C43FBFD|nr:hypothetical protein [Corynebacterium sp. TAE3-ERU2]MBV7302943.1 hypothetical protein [Corynebacterium sp. TAE3-ERU2]